MSYKYNVKVMHRFNEFRSRFGTPCLASLVDFVVTMKTLRRPGLYRDKIEFLLNTTPHAILDHGWLGEQDIDLALDIVDVLFTHDAFGGKARLTMSPADTPKRHYGVLQLVLAEIENGKTPTTPEWVDETPLKPKEATKSKPDVTISVRAEYDPNARVWRAKPIEVYGMMPSDTPVKCEAKVADNAVIRGAARKPPSPLTMVRPIGRLMGMPNAGVYDAEFQQD